MLAVWLRLTFCAVVPLATKPAAGAAAADESRTNAIPASQFRVCVDPRVELFSLVFRFAGNREYNQGKVDSYNGDVEKHFGNFRDHTVIKLARQLRQTRGVSYDACMSLAIHVNNADALQLVTPLQPWPDGLDSRWTAESVTNFLSAARQFVKDTSFAEFIEQHRPLYTSTTGRLERVLREAHLEWFDSYFGNPAEGSFTVTAGLLNGPGCYGPHCQKQMYCILGVWQVDRNGMPEFTPEMLATVVHEFCHSYANRIVDRHEQELKAAGHALYDPMASRMQSQAYGDPQTLLRESLVRACTVRYQLQYYGVDAARKEIEHNKNRGFLWTKELSDSLAEYETQRDRYPTLESFAPRLVLFFNQYADAFKKEQATLATRRPKVVSMSPANGASSVDPGLAEIRVIFDRPMKDRSWSCVGGGPHFPELGTPYYDSNRTTWTVPVKLKPEWDYEFYFNRNQFNSFQSEEGTPLESVHVTFTTGKAMGDPARD